MTTGCLIHYTPFFKVVPEGWAVTVSVTITAQPSGTTLPFFTNFGLLSHH